MGPKTPKPRNFIFDKVDFGILRYFCNKMGCADSTAGGSKTSLTVEYFGLGYARADPIRFLLHHAKVDYQYIGYDFEQPILLQKYLNIPKSALSKIKLRGFGVLG